MTDWTEADLNGFLPGEPITAAKALLWYENPIAISEGSPDAPRIYLRALETLEPGAEIRSRRDEDVSVTSDTQTVLSFDFIQYGTIRCTTDKTTGPGTIRIRRVRNNSTSTLFSETSSGVKVLDVDVLPGDTVFFELEAATLAGTVRNTRFQTDGQDLWPGVSARLEGNRSAA
jgi:hypothetical protein